MPRPWIPYLLLLVCLPVLLHAQQVPLPSEEPMNVLFIAVDDLRPELGSYGSEIVSSPHLDGLAAEGVVFTRHYVQVPTCGASRFALLTGQRPRTTAHLGNNAFLDLLPGSGTDAEEPESFVHQFRRAGYTTVGLGKISHYPDGRVLAYDGTGDGRLEMPLSWSEVWGPVGRWGSAWNAFFAYGDGTSRGHGREDRPAYEMPDVEDNNLPDGLIAAEAVRRLEDLAAAGEPFLLAVGFFKPHLPFVAPRRYWDLYDPAEIPLSPDPGAPQGINPRALHDSGEFFGNYDSHPSVGGAGVRIDDAYAQTLRHGYLASVSYVDAQIGRVLSELERLGLASRTIVVVWGDHGWHLGDHTIWGKHSTFERSLHSPLIIRDPRASNPGWRSDAIVETVDIYPTLLELAGVPAPAGLDGQSFADALADPSFIGRCLAYGYYHGRTTLRTDRFRITEYVDGEPRVELFDHQTDPLETRNVADLHPGVVQRLLPLLRSEALGREEDDRSSAGR